MVTGLVEKLQVGEVSCKQGHLCSSCLIENSQTYEKEKKGKLA